MSRVRLRAEPRFGPELEPELEVEGVGSLAPGGEVGLGGGDRRRRVGPALAVAVLAGAAVVVVATTGGDGAPPAPAATTVSPTTAASAPRTPAFELPPDVPGAVRVAPLDLGGTQLRALVRRPQGPLALAVVDLATGTTVQLTPVPSLVGERLQLFAVGEDTFLSDGTGSAMVITADGIERRINGATQSLVFPSARPGEVWAWADSEPGSPHPQLRRVQLDDGRVSASFDFDAPVTPLGDTGDGGGFLVTAATGGTYLVDPGGEPPRRVAEGLVLGQVGDSWLERVCDGGLACSVRLRPADDPEAGLSLAEPLVVGDASTFVPTSDGARAAFLTTAGPGARLTVIDLTTGASEPVPDAPEDAGRYGRGSLGWSADGQVLFWTTSDRVQRWSLGAPRPAPVTFLEEDNTILDVIAFVAVAGAA